MDESDQPVPYQADAALKMLTDPDFVRFRNSVMATARAFSAETRADREAAAKLTGCLLWHLEWAEHEDFLRGLAEEEGRIPKALLDRPDIRQVLLPVWEAFHALSGDRQQGMGLGAIPFVAIDRYAARYGFDEPEPFRRFHALIGAMDAEFLSHWAEKARATAS